MYKLLMIIALCFISFQGITSEDKKEKPNILWLVCEDISPYLGAYGCKEAYTPNLDKMAEKGMRFTHAYANAPVCAIARSTLLSGIYATSTGTHHMRGRQILPAGIPAYSRILMDGGYYCTNNDKTDYNSNFEFEKNNLWDETSSKAHWKNRPDGKPFFAVFNIGCTHEGQLCSSCIPGYIERGEIPKTTRVNPANIDLPPYHPDLPEIRQDWARFHDMITRMDEIVGMRLKELEKEGVADNTIVFFYSDHGGQISRTKRFIYNGGTQVPFIVYLPEKWKHLAKTKAGETYDNLVSFVDFPKTLLSIAGCKIPEIMQGHIFLGKDREESPKYVHLYRDRMDEQPGFARAVTDGKYHFIRNFMPHCPEGRLLYYPYDVQANWGAWKNYFELGKCNETQSRFFQTNPVLKFFDVEKDKWEVENLANKPEFQKKVKKMSDELDRWMIQNRDLGLVPEAMFFELIGKNKKYKTLYEYAQSSDYEIERILGVAKAASFGDQSKVSEYLQYMNDDNPIVRYWGAYGVFLAKEKGNTALEALKHMVQNDDIAANRLMAAQGLGLSGDRDFACWAILKELEATNDASIFHAGLMALLFSHTDVMLGEKDWQKLRSHAFPNNIGIDQTVAYYSMQIINGILQTWPDKIRVD